MPKTNLIKVFNELMEKERDEYLENNFYQRNLIEVLTVIANIKVTIKKIGTLALRVSRI